LLEEMGIDENVHMYADTNLKHTKIQPMRYCIQAPSKKRGEKGKSSLSHMMMKDRIFFHPKIYVR
jgi:hypothetical protein